jgi:hypothetical protein
MTLDVSFQPMRVLIDGHDTDGRLILANNQLYEVEGRQPHALEPVGLACCGHARLLARW